MRGRKGTGTRRPAFDVKAPRLAGSRFCRLGRASRGMRVREGLSLLLAGLLFVACAGGDGNDDDDTDSVTDAAPTANRPDTNPPGTEPTAVAPYLSELLLAYDRIVTEIVADPAVAENSEDPLVQDFLALYEEDSSEAAEMVDLWAERADEGLRTEPYRDDYPTLESSLDGEPETVSEDEVTFAVCVVDRSRVVDAEGEEVGQSLPRLDHPGEGTAVRSETGWRLRELVVWSDELSCNGGEGQ